MGHSMPMERRTVGLALLATTILIGTATIAPAQTLDLTEAKARFQAAVADTARAEPSEVATGLFAVDATNPRQTWRMNGSRREVLVLSWMSKSKLLATFPNQTEQSLAPGVSGAAVPGRDIWVTVVPELRDFCAGFPLTGNALQERLKQYLGLNSEWNYHGLTELWVSPNDLFRPCVDPEVEDGQCNIPGGPVPSAGRGADPAYQDWYNKLEAVSYGESGAPWTRLGYTYDWGNPTGEVGASEYVIAPGAPVVLNTIASPDLYCRPAGITDVVLTVGNNAAPTPAPAGFTLVGQWDVDGGGSTGTDGSTGHYMAGLYIKKGPAQGPLVKSLFLTASNDAKPRPVDLGGNSSKVPYQNLGFWDVDGGGSVGTDGLPGHYAMGLFKRSAPQPSRCYLTDVRTTASNDALPRSAGPDYRLVGYWDADGGGARGTDGSTGHYMVGLYTQTTCR